MATKKSDSGAFAVTPTEKEFVVLDQLKVIADELDTSVAAVALAWVRSRPGISSTIIGARRMGQLDANLAALKRGDNQAHSFGCIFAAEPFDLHRDDDVRRGRGGLRARAEEDTSRRKVRSGADVRT